MRIENAVRLAILATPQAFGLRLEAVNPLLLYNLREDERMSLGTENEVTWTECFDECSVNLEAKLIEVLAEPPAQPSNGKSTRTASKGKDAPAAVRTDKVTAKQLRKIGFLMHQLGQKPDYKQIGSLTMSQASARIAELEKEVKG